MSARDRSRGKLSNPIEIDTLPFAGMMLLLIPMLLASVQFASMATVDASAPAIGEHTTKPPKERLALTVGVHALGYSVTADPQAMKELGWEQAVDLPMAVHGYDYAALTDLMRSVKDRYPGDDELIVTPSDDVAFDMVVATMDATRSDASGELFPAVAFGAVKE
ncbi:MAG: biopolymer transporter ExbD [Deltaproteobacteria bacterium]|nr:biopolymer transporter ExbD [Deltaproteobacteria bacterium]